MYPNLIPIAGFDPKNESPHMIPRLKKMGFRGIKLHPRFSGFSLEKNINQIQNVLKKAEDTNMVVFWCSYEFCSVENMPNRPFLYDFSKVIAPFKKLKHVIMHGGGIYLMSWVEFTRFNSNILLDLSLVLTKYENSSIDQDIHYVFSKFDQRICIGSDYPEWTHQKIRERFEYFSKSISEKKQKNIAYENIKNWLKD